MAILDLITIANERIAKANALEHDVHQRVALLNVLESTMNNKATELIKNIGKLKEKQREFHKEVKEFNDLATLIVSLNSVIDSTLSDRDRKLNYIIRKNARG